MSFDKATARRTTDEPPAVTTLLWTIALFPDVIVYIMLAVAFLVGARW